MMKFRTGVIGVAFLILAVVGVLIYAPVFSWMNTGKSPSFPSLIGRGNPSIPGVFLYSTYQQQGDGRSNQCWWVVVPSNGTRRQLTCVNTKYHVNANWNADGSLHLENHPPPGIEPSPDESLLSETIAVAESRPYVSLEAPQCANRAFQPSRKFEKMTEQYPLGDGTESFSHWTLTGGGARYTSPDCSWQLRDSYPQNHLYLVSKEKEMETVYLVADDRGVSKTPGDWFPTPST